MEKKRQIILKRKSIKTDKGLFNRNDKNQKSRNKHAGMLKTRKNNK